jgi:hypothetical protein
MGACATFPSPRLRGEGGAAVAAEGEGAVQFRTPASLGLGFASAFPLPLKGARGFGIAPQGDQDCLKHTIHVRHDVGIREADYSVTALFEVSRSSGIVRLSVTMGVAVELDHEAFASTGEVGDIGGENSLLLEFHAEPVGAKVVPETALGFGQIPSQVLRAVSCLDVPLQTAPSPRSASQSRPLPLEGVRGNGRHAITPFHESFAVNA